MSSADWSEGYVVSVDYTKGFYRELAPSLISFAALLKGKRPPRIDREFTCCELGCGLGISAAVNAASLPQGRFYANDFNPNHILFARELAEESGTDNVLFLEKSFEELQRCDLPEFDFITLHGVYSWISDKNRELIRTFIRDRLKPGGLVYLSYNALPGWAAAAPLRKIFSEIARQNPAAPAADNLKKGFALIDLMEQTGAAFFRANPAMKSRVERMKSMPANYLAHEYLTEDWAQFYHSDVAAQMAGAKVGFVGSLQVVDLIEGVALPKAAATLLQTVTDPDQAETIKDYVLNRQFRTDVYARGTRELSPPEREEILTRTRFALLRPRTECPLTVRFPLGEVNLDEKIYGPLLNLLEAAPVSAREVKSRAETAELADAAVMEALMILTAAGYIQPLPGTGQEVNTAPARRFNDAALRRLKQGRELPALASPVLGHGLPVGLPDQLFLAAEQEGRGGDVRFVYETMSRLGRNILKDGKAMESEGEAMEYLERLAREFTEKRAGLLRMLGVWG